MSHEVTKTFRVGDKWVVAASIYNGRELSEDEVADHVKNGKIKALGRFDTLQDADEYARDRSERSIMGRHK